MNRFDKLNAITNELQSGSAVMIMFCTKQEEDKSSMAGITHRIRFYILGVVLLVDSTDDWAVGNE